MINITNEIEINSNDYILAVKTLFEELIFYFRNKTNLTKASFDGLELTDFAGLNYVFANYQEIKKARTNLETLLGFSISIPNDFDIECRNKINLDLILRSEICSDITLKQNHIFDYLRYSLTDRQFFWQGKIATDINNTNSENINSTDYTISNFIEVNQDRWIQSQLQDNYVISQQSYTFNIHRNN